MGEGGGLELLRREEHRTERKREVHRLTWDSGLSYWMEGGAPVEDRGYKTSEGIHGCASGGDFSLGHVECELLVRQAVEVLHTGLKLRRGP